ncbi:MAG: PQQ-dependent sugar dehydrogenase [Calditrichaceae bacterium]
MEGSELGLLGLAFHPNFKENGYFYVDYTAPNPTRTVIARYKVSDDDPDSANPDSAFTVLEINQPEGNHNGGQIAFGPDGYLYIATGDGGGSGDDHGEFGNGQNLSVLLGKILRIDVNHTDGGLNYAIPEDNPFAGNQDNYREEIFAYGLRNPWRFSFDPETGMIWAGDVGQDDYEEIDIIESGHNYGWRIMEGFHCYNPSTNCDQSGMTLPIWEYDHNTGYSVTGGYVYRGKDVPELYGKYIYADYGMQWIWALTYDGENPAQNETLVQSSFPVPSFGTDENNELYICTFNGTASQIYKFKPTVTSSLSDKELIVKDFYLGNNYPNPFNPGTTIPYNLNKRAKIKIFIYDINGRLIRELVSKIENAGNYSVYWDGKNIGGKVQPSGIYFCQMQADGKSVTTKRLILLK